MPYGRPPPPRRRYAPPPPPPGSHNRQHSLLGYWLPLVTLSTIAVGGLAAWAWSERSSHDDDEGYPDEKPSRPPGSGNHPTGQHQQQSNVGAGGQAPPQQPYQPPPGGEASDYYGASRDTGDRTDQTFISRMIRRTPSPQQFFDSASKQVAAAGAVLGLGRILEEDGSRGEEREGFSDHERWSEEAVGREEEEVVVKERKADGNRPTRTVAVVVSADVGEVEDSLHYEGGLGVEHGSLLSHLPTFIPANTTLYILIHAPNLTALPPLPDTNPPITPLGSSYATLPPPSPSEDPTFTSLHSLALTLLPDSPQNVLPFTTPTGYLPILRHLSPGTVYLSSALAGEQGTNVAALREWVGQIVLVAGDEGGVGGLVDSETDTETEGKRRRWYDDSAMVGLGKGVEVVDVGRVGDDWRKRVGGRE